MTERAVQKIVRDVREWAGTRVEEDVLRCLEILLDSRAEWLKCADPTFWKTGDMHRLLNEGAATRLTDLCGMDVHAPEALRTLVGFLEETDRVHPATMRVAALRKELDRAAEKFPALMADEPGWRMAKRFFMAMRADGVDITGSAAAESWMAAFNEAPDSRRRAVLGPLLDHSPEFRTARFVVRGSRIAAGPLPPEFTDPEPLPPLSLPPAVELAAQTREFPLLRRIVACGQWAAAGRKVTRQGFLAPAETRTFAEALDLKVPDDLRGLGDRIELISAWRVGLGVEALRLHRTQVVAGPALPVLERMLAGRADPAEALETWHEIADVALDDAAAVDQSDRKAFKITEFCRPWGPRALDELSRSEGKYETDGLVAELMVRYADPGISPSLVVLTTAAVYGALLAAYESGVVTASVPPDVPDPAEDLDWAMNPVPGTTVTLTPLGRSFVHTTLRRQAS